MLHYKVIGLPAAEHGFDITEPFCGESRVDGIHDRRFFIGDDI